MTRYSRSVIPGRPNGERGAHDVDALVFGKKRGANPSAANDEDDDLADGEAIHLVERAASDRRKGSRRRKSDFAPLPQEGRGYRAPQEGSKRGPILLIGALIIVGVFSVVVWNAYRDGVRPEDSAATPVLAEAGAFKTKPDTAKTSDNVEASVFERVEAPKAAIVPAPETRESAFVLPPHTPQVTPSAPAAVTPAPAPATPPPSTTTVKTTAKPPVQPATAAAKPAPAQPAAPPPKPVVTTAKSATTQPPAVTPSPPPATAAVPAPLQTASAPAPKSEAIQLAGAYTPSFAADGKYIVQVAAASSEEGANAEWAKRVKAAPDLFGAAEKSVVQADVNGRTVYRLRAGSFATSAEADAFCTAYKARGGACFRTAK